MARLTEANYQSRRIKLGHQIADAQRAYTEAAYKLELGQVDEATVAAARDLIHALKDRLSGLDTAWLRAQDEDASARTEAELGKRQVATDAIEGHLADRAAAAELLGDAALALGNAYRQFEATGARIVKVTAPFAADMGNHNRANLRDLLTSEFHDVRPIIGGIMADAGLFMSGNHFAAAPFREHSHQMTPFVTRQNYKIRAYTEKVGGLNQAEQTERANRERQAAESAAA